MTYSNTLNQLRSRFPSGAKAGIAIEDLAQLKTQNTYNTHLDIAKSMASVMREDMARYDADSRQFTQSLGCLVFMPCK
jgi:isocitrate lyase